MREIHDNKKLQGFFYKFLAAVFFETNYNLKTDSFGYIRLSVEVRILVPLH